MPKPPDNAVPFIALQHVDKSYAGVRVLKDISFAIRPGQVLALLGENGAGKSTLKNILCGLVAPDAGTLVCGQRERPRLTPADTRNLGIAAIHQELSLFPNLSVAENIHMGVGSFPKQRGLVDREAMLTETRRLLSDLFETPVDPQLPLERLSLGERQLVEVAKALHRASAMLIFDEPTTSLSLPERRRLFGVVRRLRQRGYAIVYITHFLEEVYELADQIVVLRDGHVVGRAPPDEIDRKQLTALMVGRDLRAIDTDLAGSRRNPGRTVLRVADLRDDRALHGVSFSLRAGEIVGLAGLLGAGRSEVAQAIFGVRSASGTVEVHDAPFVDRTPQSARSRGLALVSEDRRNEQIFPGRSLRENLTVTILGKLTFRVSFLSRARQRQRAAALIAEHGVRASGLEIPMAALSGGNQQKCVIGRWLATEPSICILDEPTKGIDVGAKAEIHLLITRLAAQGLGVLLISSDLPELLALSHRILVMHKGRVAGELDRPHFDPVAVLHMASTGVAA